MSFRFLLTMALALLAGSGVALAAAGAQKAVDSTATIYFTAPDEMGLTVNSSDERCEPQRVVRFRKVRSGADKNLFTKTTAGNGWAIKRYEAPPGRYYGKVREREAEFGTCAQAKSGTTTVG